MEREPVRLALLRFVNTTLYFSLSPGCGGLPSFKTTLIGMNLFMKPLGFMVHSIYEIG